MTTKTLLILVLFAAVFQVAALQQQSSVPANAAAREQGKLIFTGKCGKCHDENARKKLSDGSTLLTRLSASKDWQSLLGTRLKSMSPENRQAVSLYVEGLLKDFQSSETK